MRATKTIHVEATPERVLSFFLDWTANPPDMTMDVVYESPDVVGNSYEWSFKMLGIPRKGVTVYTDYAPGKRLAMRNLGFMEGTSELTVEPENGGSRVTQHVESRLAIPVIGRFFDPFLRREWKKMLKWSKSEMEKQPIAKKATV